MEELNLFKEELKRIEKDGRSFLGMDGGNIESDIWFCGIEFGGKLSNMAEYYESTVNFKPAKEFDIPIPYRKSAGKYENSPYDKRLAIMYFYLFSNENKVYGPINMLKINDILKEELYNFNSKIFKLNLYPLGKKDTSWDNEITSLTGITKEKYYNDLFEKRKLFIKELVDKFLPKIIICTSTNGMEEEFVEAFLNENQKFNYSCEYFKTLSKKEFKISNYTTDTVSIIVIPFLGRCNLNSYDDVIQMTNHLKVNYLNKLNLIQRG